MQTLHSNFGEGSVWKERLNREILDYSGSFRISVVGESFTGTTELVNALLEHDAPIQPARIVNGKFTPVISRITYRGNSLKGAITSDSTWLNENRIDLVDVPTLHPGFYSSRETENAILHSDLLVVVTNSMRQLTGNEEANIVKSHVCAGKRNIVIVLNENSRNSVEDLKNTIRDRVKHLVGEEIAENLPLVFYVSTCQAPTGQNRNQPEYEEAWAESGLRDLKNLVVGMLLERSKHKEFAARYVAGVATHELVEQLKVAMSRQILVRSKLDEISNRSKEEQKRVQEEVELNFMILKVCFTGIGAKLRRYLDKIPGWKLLFMADRIAEDLGPVLTKRSLGEVERRMPYVAGLVSEAGGNTHRRIQEELKSLVIPGAHILPESLAKEIRQLELQGIDFDSQILLEPLSSFDESELADTLQNNAQVLLRNNMLGQESGLLVTQLGTPFAITFPGTVLVSGLAMAWMGSRWSRMKERFVLEAVSSQQGLAAKLKGSFSAHFAQMVSQPLEKILRSADESIAASQREIAERIEKVDKLVRGQ
ncbi:hypothetical protein BJ742DRAFT_779551 [Cladochytrium replicatum]|nr:hypothetical protein BJ742DRAFT_779551 [Cladochytrium replicatum]